MNNVYMVNVRTIGIVGLLLGLLPACSWWSEQSKQEKKNNVLVINVLDKALYDDCHIQGSINVPFENIENFVQKLDKDTVEIILYCTNYLCSASASAYKKLHAMGFEHVWAYEGGMAEWYQLGLPVEGACKERYLANVIQNTKIDTSQEIMSITAQELVQKMK